MDNLKNEILEMKNLLIIMNNNIKNIEDKINLMEKKINNEVLDECKKMGSHIDFIEKVYENVKHPLGYITNKINIFSNKETKYSLTDNKNI